MWQDYKQIYIDFGLDSDELVRNRVLFVNSFDCDYNSRQEELQYDSKGFFLLDTRVKPAKPLTIGLPLTYETKEKDYDLSDKGAMF